MLKQILAEENIVDNNLETVRNKVHNIINIITKEQYENKPISNIPVVSAQDFVNYNDYLCLKALTEKPLTRDELSSKINLARTTTFDTLQRLLLREYIIQINLKKTNRGRPIALFFAVVEFNDDE